MKEFMKEKERRVELVKGSPPNSNWGREPKRLEVADVKSSGEEAEEKKKKEEKEMKRRRKRKGREQMKRRAVREILQRRRRKRKRTRRKELQTALMPSKQPLSSKSGRTKRSTRIKQAISSEKEIKGLRIQEYKQGM